MMQTGTSNTPNPSATDDVSRDKAAPASTTSQADHPHSEPGRGQLLGGQDSKTVDVNNNALTVFVESPPLLARIADDIRKATKRVWVEVYTFFNDEGPTKVAEAMKERAQAGLDVRLIYDALGSNTTPREFFHDMEKAGVKVHEYHSILEGLRRFRPFTIVNRRDHRKLIVIDDAIGYFGGMNLIDNVQKIEDLKAQDKPTSSGWRDVHLRLEGPAQHSLAESYERSWSRAKGLKVTRRSRMYRRALHLHGSPHDPHAADHDTIRFFDSGPGLKYSRSARVFSRLLRHARHEVTISMAYFIPTGMVLRALLSARRRDVKIRVVVPGKSDVQLVQRATTYIYGKLLKRGFELYERQQRMLHSKTMVVDDLYSVVGSCNLDPRSLFINLEFLAVIRSQDFAKLICEIATFELKHSKRVTIESTHLPILQRLLNTGAWLLRWWL